MPGDYITNTISDGSALGFIGQLASDEIQRTSNKDIAAAAQIALQTAQLIAYWNLFDDAVDKRDEAIDFEMTVLQELDDYKENQDLPMLDTKADILGLGVPSPYMCSDARLYANMSVSDGDGVDLKSIHLAAESCGGIPRFWGTHEGSLMGAEAASYSGGILANSEKRRSEDFRKKKTDLVLEAQNGLKSSYNASETLAKYSQYVSIYSGLSDLYIQGFNSAGAGLGVAMGQLSTGTGNSISSASANQSTTGTDARGI